ncbi:MAG: agmatine deiminase family protein [Salinivirgaceae bacterium]|nr:agmatine deiminase family protein [Salinivirgaceae bacterium]
MKNKEIISPFMEGAFSEPILHKIVLSKIDFELSDEIWGEINAGFEHYWDVEVGVGNSIYFAEAYRSILTHLELKGILLPYEQLWAILEAIFDFIEQIPGALIGDDDALITWKKDPFGYGVCFSENYLKTLKSNSTNTDRNTNIVFLSKCLKKESPSFFSSLTELMDEMGIRWSLLESTRDIWVRDFMPIQLSENEFIKYKYAPDYLRGDDEHTTDCKDACKALDINYRETKLIIDGGNIVPCGDYYVMTNKVFTENGKRKNDMQFKQLLEKELGRQVIIIPWHQIGDANDPNTDVYGHSDGFVKWCGGNKVLMSNHRDTDAREADAIRRILESYGFEVTEMLFDVEKPNPDWNWAYINFLQVGNKIIMPSFEIDEDKQALEYVHNAFPDCDVRQIDMRDIAEKGGALHCITWNIKYATVRSDYEEYSGLVFDELKPLAEQGLLRAQFYLAWCYKYGEGVKKDIAKAVEWLMIAAEQGYAPAQNCLGFCYEFGDGVEKDLNKAIEWYTKAAEQGDIRAQSNLILCLDELNGKNKTDY